MGQGPDEVKVDPEEAGEGWDSEPPASVPMKRAERKPIPKQPQPMSAEAAQVVVATTPLATPPSATTRPATRPVPAAVSAGEAEPEAIREDIAQTRAEMSSTIDAIQERLDPQRLVEEAKDAAKDAVQGAVQQTTGAVREATIGKAEHMVSDVSQTAQEASSTIMDTIRENPIPATLAAVGIGWLVMSARNRSSAGQAGRYEARTYPPATYPPPPTIGQSRSGTGQVVSKAQETVGDVADQVKETAGQVASGAQDLVSGATDTASQVVSSASRTAGGAGSSLLETVRQNPVPAALVGVGIAWLMRNRDTSALPDTSRPYQPPIRTRSPMAVDVRDTVGDVASQAMDQAGALASQAKNQAGALGDQAHIRAQQAQGQLQRLWDDNPLALGAVAVGLGAAVGLAAPGTRQESQLMGEARDRLLDTAQTVAQETQQKVQRVAKEA